MASRHPLIEAKKSEFTALLDHLKKELSSIRTGRASPALLEHVLVEAYGVKTPLAQLAALSVPDPKTLVIQPWDKNVLKDIERGIVASNIGMMPVVDGDRVRLTLPPLTEETRRQLTKVVKEKFEGSRQHLRRLRDTIRDTILAKEKEGGMSEDDRYRVQRELDEYIQEIQKQLTDSTEQKEKEIMTV
ncbi:ribosome recycling factor [Candidatus Uhrbacteria bacterium]|nr:ribosome recycling factor [Candidatus Uhrbacteria bacterium]